MAEGEGETVVKLGPGMSSHEDTSHGNGILRHHMKAIRRGGRKMPTDESWYEWHESKTSLELE